LCEEESKDNKTFPAPTLNRSHYPVITNGQAGELQLLWRWEDNKTGNTCTPLMVCFLRGLHFCKSRLILLGTILEVQGQIMIPKVWWLCVLTNRNRVWWGRIDQALRWEVGGHRRTHRKHESKTCRRLFLKLIRL
jgi:hypothetical protein